MAIRQTAWGTLLPAAALLVTWLGLSDPTASDTACFKRSAATVEVSGSLIVVVGELPVTLVPCSAED
jgi:hypothetical protein